MRLIYHPNAESELIEAAAFYERRVATLGSQFLTAFENAVRIVESDPVRWAIIEADVRRYLMPRFPFAILYRIAGDDLRILAVKHHSRHPAYWRKRINE